MNSPTTGLASSLAGQKFAAGREAGLGLARQVTRAARCRGVLRACSPVWPGGVGDGRDGCIQRFQGSVTGVHAEHATVQWHAEEREKREDVHSPVGRLRTFRLRGIRERVCDLRSGMRQVRSGSGSRGRHALPNARAAGHRRPTSASATRFSQRQEPTLTQISDISPDL